MAADNIEGTLSALVKEMYPKEQIGSTLLEGSSLYSEIPKDWKGHGRHVRVPVKYAATSGTGNDFAETQNAHDEAQRDVFQVTWYDDYAIFRITDKTIKLCRGAMHGVVEALTEVADDAMDAIKRRMHWAMWRDGGGSMGQIAAGSGSTTITLANIEDIVHFSVNQQLESHNTNGIGATAGDGEYHTITAINEDDGTISKAAGSNWNANGNFAANDHLFARGTIGQCVRGIRAWLPANAPVLGVDSFYGVDRGRHPTALAGVRFNATGAHGTIQNYLIKFASRLARNKARPTHVYLNPVDFGQLVSELGDQVKYDKAVPKNSKGMPVQGHIGFQHIVMSVGSGMIKVFSEADVPYGLCYMLDMPCWKLRAPEEPSVLNADGLYMARMGNGADYEGRMGCYWQIACKAPGKNGVGTLTAIQQPA
ncbi:MAG: hypothetical protein AAGF11_48655 [Myxococcota bacterium]